MDPTFLFVPSPLLGPAVWAPVAKVVAGHGHRVGEVAAATRAPASPAQVADRMVEAVPVDDVVLVVHSNAGLYVPVVTARRPDVVAVVFVDAGLPPSTGSVPLAPAAMLDRLRSLADDDSTLPPWTSWFDEEDIAGLFPDPRTRERVSAEQPCLPLACLDATLDVPVGWDRRPIAYLAFGETYAEERERAIARGWPTATLDGGHLHMLCDPDAVAPAIIDLFDLAT